MLHKNDNSLLPPTNIRLTRRCPPHTRDWWPFHDPARKGHVTCLNDVHAKCGFISRSDTGLTCALSVISLGSHDTNAIIQHEKAFKTRPRCHVEENPCPFFFSKLKIPILPLFRLKQRLYSCHWKVANMSIHYLYTDYK